MGLPETLMKIVVKVQDVVALAKRFETSPMEAMREVVGSMWQAVAQVAVGTALRLISSGRPPHRSQRALLTHWALASDVDARAHCCLA